MNLFSVIENKAPNKCLVWKNPEEQFNTKSQLIVSESEVALFYKDGVIVQSYTAGKYTLDTNILPFFKRLLMKMSNGRLACSCKVFFINKTHRLDLKWGTESPIPVRDAEFKFAVGVRARGAYTVQIKDEKKFLLKILGTNVQMFTDQELSGMFRSAFQSMIKVAIANVLKQQNRTVLDMATEYENIANTLRPRINAALDEYGLRCVNFYIDDISIPEDDPNYRKINEAYARVGSRGIEGISWQQEQAAGMLHELARNPGAGGIGAMGAGMGMGFAAGNVFGGLANQMFQPMSGQSTSNSSNNTKNAGGSRFSPIGNGESNTVSSTTCPSCGTANASNAKFCSNCGQHLQAVCPSCKVQIAPGARFCNNCGAKL